MSDKTQDSRTEQQIAEQLKQKAAAFVKHILDVRERSGTTGEWSLKLVHRKGLLVEIHLDDHVRVRATESDSSA